MMYTMPKNLLSICVNFALATQLRICRLKSIITSTESALHDMLEYDK